MTSIGSSGHMGSITAYYGLTNRSPRRCSLAGFPQVRLVDARQRPYPVTVLPHGDAQRVVLTPGATAYTSVNASHVEHRPDEGAPCDPPAAALWLIPPGGSGHLTDGDGMNVCGGTVDVESFATVRPSAA